jgi:hypothetical protein
VAGGLTNRGATKRIEDVIRTAIVLALRKRTYTVASIAALRAITSVGASGSQAITDWTLTAVTGSGLYRWSTFSTATDDGTSVIKPTDAGTAGRWIAVENPGGMSTPLMLRGTDVTDIASGYLKQVALYEGERTDDELEGRIFAQRPCVVLEFVGATKERIGTQPGALSHRCYNFQLWIVDNNARGDLTAHRGSEVAAELAVSPGAYNIAADLEDLLDGATGEQLGEVAIGYSFTGATTLIDKQLADRGRIILQVELGVWATTGKQDNDAVDFESIRGQLKTAIVRPPGEDVDPDNVIVEGLNVTMGIGLTRSPASGSAKIDGTLVEYTATPHTFAAFTDTYRDLASDGTLTFTEVAIGADAPDQADGTLRVGYTRTDAVGVDSDVLLAPTLRNLGSTFPIAT